MKLKSLILGSVAAAGLSTAGYAADLGVLTSLDVCDSLGISGLTLSSTDHCLAITGNVSYEFSWGDYAGTAFGALTRAGEFNVPDNNASAATAGVPGLYQIYDTRTGALIRVESNTVEPTLAANEASRVVVTPIPATPAGLDNDWSSKVEAWVQFVGSSSTDFGRAAATIKLKSVSHNAATNETVNIGGDATNGGALNGNGIWIMDEAFVQVGDTTTIMAGKKGSIANFGDDEPLNFLRLFNSEKVDNGVMFAKDNPKSGGHVIQVVSAVADGVTVKVGLENLEGSASGSFPSTSIPGGAYYGPSRTAGQSAGTLVGVVEYAGNGFKAHATGLAGGVLDGTVENWATHAGFSGTFDMFSFVAAGAYSGNINNDSYWNVLGSAKATFDIFEIALSGEANGGYNGGVGEVPTQAGLGASVGASVIEGVKLNLGGRWFDENTNTANNETYQVAAQIVAAVTETISLTGEVGVYGTNKPIAEQTDFYGSAQLEWKPGGGFTSSLKGEAHQTGAYKVTFKAAKEFK